MCLCHLSICTGLTRVPSLLCITHQPSAGAAVTHMLGMTTATHPLHADPAMMPLLQILAGLIEESDNPATLLEALMLHLLPPRKDANSAAYRCETCLVLMQLCHGNSASLEQVDMQMMQWPSAASSAPAPSLSRASQMLAGRPRQQEGTSRA